jgi:hypothetical protein
VVFEGIPRRKLNGSGTRAERINFTYRIVTDEFLGSADCRSIVQVTPAESRH